MRTSATAMVIGFAALAFMPAYADTMTINENERSAVLSEIVPGNLVLVRAQRQQASEPTFDPPKCVSGADTYCQPVSKSAP